LLAAQFIWEVDMNRRLVLILVGVVVALGVIGAAAGGVVYYFYPVQVSTLAGMTRNYLISWSAPRPATSARCHPCNVRRVSVAFGAGSVGTSRQTTLRGARPTAPAAQRRLYFSEVLSDPSNPASPTNFFITVDGAPPTLFDPNNPPAITTRQGSVEDWTIQNRSGENHEFHMHQIHFLLIAVNGVPAPPEQRQFYDTYQVPYWTGTGPYPSITVRMDFRSPDIGDFVYHCHILGHEDAGMMAIIRILPRL
jgi:hypothetical protein